MQRMLADWLPLILVKMVMAASLRILSDNFTCIFTKPFIMRMVRHFYPVVFWLLLCGACVGLHSSLIVLKLFQSNAFVVNNEGLERVPVWRELVLGIFTILFFCWGDFFDGKVCMCSVLLSLSVGFLNLALFYLWNDQGSALELFLARIDLQITTTYDMGDRYLLDWHIFTILESQRLLDVVPILIVFFVKIAVKNSFLFWLDWDRHLVKTRNWSLLMDIFIFRARKILIWD